MITDSGTKSNRLVPNVCRLSGFVGRKASAETDHAIAHGAVSGRQPNRAWLDTGRKSP